MVGVFGQCEAPPWPRHRPRAGETIQGLECQAVAFVSLTESIDTTTPGGRLVFHLFGASAEFERDRIRERTMADPQPPGPRAQARETNRMVP